MTEREKGDSILRSWKEIAAHLGVDGRTCARWEKKFGLPVHRAQGKKSRVVAYRHELDAWFQKTFRNQQEGANAAARRTSQPRIWLWSLPAIVLVAIGAWLLLPSIKPAPNPSERVPADFRIEGSVLVILDRAGQALGSYDTGLANLWSDKKYKDIALSNKSPARDIGNRFVLFHDLHGDGRREVLFVTQTWDELNEGDLICLSDRGDRIWSFHAGREMRYGTKTFSADYRISYLGASDLDGDGRMEVFLASVHNPEWPCQLSLLTCDGILLGEYWNSGHINDIVTVDFDSDGRKELLAGGLNNECRQACLVALDSRGFFGSSPNSGEFRHADFPSGREIAYIRLPRTDIDQLESLYMAVDDIRLMAGGNIQILTQISALFFEFRPDLTLQQILPSHAFEFLHRKYYEAGKVKTPYTEEEYIKPLEKQVLYFDGQGWTTTPTTKLRPAR